jgi:hypothetical protein
VLQSFNGNRVAYPITYLRLPITLGRLRMVHLQPLFERASTKLAGWQGNLLNLGGRRELVATVLGSLPTYLLMALKPPKKFYKDMDKLRRRFLWVDNQPLHGGKCKVSWTRVCRPISRGGLGITDLERFGCALRIWWLWYQWKNPEKSWCDSELRVDKIDEALLVAAT